MRIIRSNKVRIQVECVENKRLQVEFLVHDQSILASILFVNLVVHVPAAWLQRGSVVHVLAADRARCRLTTTIRYRPVVGHPRGVSTSRVLDFVVSWLHAGFGGLPLARGVTPASSEPSRVPPSIHRFLVRVRS